MIAIQKYPFALFGAPVFSIAGLIKIVSVHRDGDIGCLWALADDSEPAAWYNFRLYADGNPIDELGSLDYLGTFQIHGFGWHLFQEK